MSRHILDGAREHKDSKRAEQFTRIDGEDRPSKQAKTLQRQPSNTSAEGRAKRFRDIERRSDS